MHGTDVVRHALDTFIVECERAGTSGRPIPPIHIVVGGQHISINARSSTKNNHIDDDVSSTIDRVYLHAIAPVCRLEPNNDQARRLMLQANNFWVGTRGATFGVYDDWIVLLMSTPLSDMTGQSLHRLLCTLAREAHNWVPRLDDLGETSPSSNLEQALLRTAFSRI